MFRTIQIAVTAILFIVTLCMVFYTYATNAIKDLIVWQFISTIGYISFIDILRKPD